MERCCVPQAASAGVARRSGAVTLQSRKFSTGKALVVAASPVGKRAARGGVASVRAADTSRDMDREDAAGITKYDSTGNSGPMDVYGGPPRLQEGLRRHTILIYVVRRCKLTLALKGAQLQTLIAE